MIPLIPPQRFWSPVLASPSMRCPVSINSCKSKRERRRQLRKHQTAAVGLEYAGKKTMLEDCKAVQLYRTHTHKKKKKTIRRDKQYTRKSASMMWRKPEDTRLLSLVNRVFLCFSMKAYTFELTHTQLIYRDVLLTMFALN